MTDNAISDISKRTKFLHAHPTRCVDCGCETLKERSISIIENAKPVRIIIVLACPNCGKEAIPSLVKFIPSKKTLEALKEK